MEENYGRVYRLLRKSKGYTLKAAASNMINIATLSRFEKGDIDLSLKNFIRILNNINVSFAEFQVVFHQYTGNVGETRYNSKFVEFCTNRNIEGLKKIMYAFDDIQKECPDNFGNNLELIMIKGVIHYFGGDITPTEAEWHYLVRALLNVDEWGFFELSLFANTAVCMPARYLNQLYKKLLVRTSYYLRIPEYRHLFFASCCNCIEQFIKTGQLEHALTIITHMENITFTEQDTYVRMMYIFWREAYDFHVSGKDRALRHMNRCTGGMEFLGYSNTAQTMKNDIDFLVKLGKKSK